MPLSDNTSSSSVTDCAVLFLACPQVELSGPNPFKQLLTHFSPRPHLAVLTGPCLPASVSEDNLKQSDVVVVTCGTPLPIEGEVQYLTELWSLGGELKDMFWGQKVITLTAMGESSGSTVI